MLSWSGLTADLQVAPGFFPSGEEQFCCLCFCKERLCGRWSSLLGAGGLEETLLISSRSPWIWAVALRVCSAAKVCVVTRVG